MSKESFEKASVSVNTYSPNSYSSSSTRSRSNSFTKYTKYHPNISQTQNQVTAAQLEEDSFIFSNEKINPFVTQLERPIDGWDVPIMGGGRSYPPLLPEKSQYIIKWDKVDPQFPHNYSLARKLLYCSIVAIATFNISLGSATFASAAPQVQKLYNVGSEVGALGTSLFVFGFAAGPVIWGPLSELYGRKLILLISSFGYSCFCFMCATGLNIQTIMITRFFEGFMGAAPMVVAPAVLADLFGTKSRGIAFSSFAMILFGGPLLAPIMGAFIVKNENLGWRWTQYVAGIASGATCLLLMLLYEETNHSCLLVKRANDIRIKTGNWGIRAPLEDKFLDFREIMENNLTKPLVMLFTEPILLLITIYNAFIYGLLYTFLTAVPLIFGGEYKFISGVSELPYLSMFIGTAIGGVICILFDIRFVKKMVENGNKMIPEERLPAMMIGSFFFSGGLFWLGWAGSNPGKIHWIVPTIGAGSIGIGLITIFLPCMNYIVDCYLVNAASALSGNNFLRSGFAGACPLFARQLFVNLEIKWASTLLGGFAAILIPVPFLFYKYGDYIRGKSKYAFN